MRLVSTLRSSPLAANISWSFLGGIGSAVLMLIATVLAGRLLGPTEYGKFSAIAAVADVLVIFLAFGMERSSMRQLAQKETEEDRGQIISFTFLFFAGLTLVVFALFWVFSPLIGRATGLTTLLLGIAFVYALMTALKLITNNFIRSLDRFRLQAWVRLVEGGLILGLFLLFALGVRSIGLTVQSYAWAVISAGFIAISLFIISLRHYFSRTLRQRDQFRAMLSHAKIFFFASILGVLFGSLDRIVIGKYLGFHELGIYAAYTTVALSFTAQINTVMGNVFFPLFSKRLNDFRAILTKVDRASFLAFIPLMVVVSIVIVIVLSIFGSSYGIIPLYVVGFSILAVVKMIFSFNAMLVDVYSKDTLKNTMLFGNLSNLFFAGVFLLLVHTVGLSIPLVLIVLILYNLVATGICKYALYRKGAYHAVPSTVL